MLLELLALFYYKTKYFRIIIELLNFDLFSITEIDFKLNDVVPLIIEGFHLECMRFTIDNYTKLKESRNDKLRNKIPMISLPLCLLILI